MDELLTPPSLCRRPARRSVASSLCDWAARLGTRHAFLVPGAQIGPLSDELDRHGSLTPIVACHELGAAYMADGYARAGEGFGLCAAIGGPGAAYMLPAAINARADRSAVLFLTGDVPTTMRAQGGFQDAGPTGTGDGATFFAALGQSSRLSRAEQLASRLAEVEQRLRHRRPAHLVVPWDVLRSQVAAGPPYDLPAGGEDSATELATAVLEAALGESRRPVILAGAGLRHRAGAEALRRLVTVYGIPFATTYGGKGILDERHPLALGNFGYGGRQEAAAALFSEEFDSLLALGTGLGQRDTLDWDRRLRPDGRRILRIDDGEPERHAPPPYLEPDAEHQVPDVAIVLRSVADRATRNRAQAGWTPTTGHGGRPLPLPAPNTVGLQTIVRALRRLAPDETVLFVDSGAHRVFAGQLWQARCDLGFYSASAIAPMGWAIAAAIGAQAALPKRPVVVLTGDGCMRMHGAEIASAVRYGLPIVYLVSNNRAYYAPRLQAGHPSAAHSIGELPEVDWASFAAVLGARGARVDSPSAIEPEIARALGSQQPTLIDLRTDPDEPLPQPEMVPAWPGEPSP